MDTIVGQASDRRAERAAELKKSGAANCCQAVVEAFADLLPGMDPAALHRLGAGFAVGMGTMEATCGALVGAGLVAGLLADGNAKAVKLARGTFEGFRNKCGATVCGDLKGRNGGPVLCECEDCCRNAVRALEETLARFKQ